MSSRPAQTLALLLHLESDTARAACVHTAIFDEALFPRRRRPPTEAYYHTKEVPVFSVHHHDLLRDVALALDRVLPQLPNLRTVRMAHAHPLLMSFHASLARRSAKKMALAPWRHNMRSYLNIFTVGEQGTTWAALSRGGSASKSGTPPVRRIERLSTRLWSRCAPPADALQHLRVLTLTGAGFHDWSAAREWTPALARLPCLDALMLSDFNSVEYSDEFGELVANGLHAPQLRTLILHRVWLSEWEHSSLVELVRRHADTLETLCLDVRWHGPARGPLFDVFAEDTADASAGLRARLPRLRVLRVHNLCGLACATCALSVEPVWRRKHGPARAAASGLYDALLRFVGAHLNRGALRELGVTGLPMEKRVAFEPLAFRLDRLVLLGGGTARATGPPPAGSLYEKERWLRDAFLLRGTPFEGEPWDAPRPRGRLRKTHPMQPTW
ncbi:hypothetical protein AURDEDRAFT_113632 [Auricularia subglabra TFB-10046 SS5]|nr:hypothetical protein AURDEDRAFT_113632 [Auricularia subglabra TFB-10046 SS5]